LVELLSAGRPQTAAALAEECGVSRRTLFRDLAVLRDAGLPVIFDDERHGFVLNRPSYLRPTEFTVPEALALISLAEARGQRQPRIPLQRHARSAALKLLSNLPNRLRDHIGRLADRIQIEIGPLNVAAVGERFHDDLLRAIHERQRVRICYDSFYEGHVIRTLLSPYCLHFHRRSWYVIGRSSLHRAVRTFNTGRIVALEAVDSSYDIPTRFRIDRYFGDAWSMIRDARSRHQVVVRFQPKVARNVAEVLWHRSQQLVWSSDGSSLEFRVTVEGLDEITWWVLGYGKEAEVLKPPELRRILKEHTRAMAAIYRRTPKP
jgi:predicted DNA-binding transcriptional regulator YafY